MPKYYRSVLARFRARVAPIRIDTGRFEHDYIPEDQRICLLCQTEVESEKHVILTAIFMKCLSMQNYALL